MSMRSCYNPQYQRNTKNVTDENPLIIKYKENNIKQYLDKFIKNGKFVKYNTLKIILWFLIKYVRSRFNALFISLFF